MGTLLPPSTALTRRIRLPFADAMLLLAVIVSGALAGALAHPAIWVATPFVAAAVWFTCRERPEVPGANDASVAFTWPAPLSGKISDTFQTLQPGNAQRRLDAVLREAKLMFSVRASAHDIAHKREMHSHVTELVAGACDMTLELALLDGVSTESPRSDYPELSARYDGACNELEAWFDDITQALSALHAAGTERSSRASERVASLATAFRHEAEPRSAGIAELLTVLKTL